MSCCYPSRSNKINVNENDTILDINIYIYIYISMGKAPFLPNICFHGQLSQSVYALQIHSRNCCQKEPNIMACSNKTASQKPMINPLNSYCRCLFQLQLVSGSKPRVNRLDKQDCLLCGSEQAAAC